MSIFCDKLLQVLLGMYTEVEKMVPLSHLHFINIAVCAKTFIQHKVHITAITDKAFTPAGFRAGSGSRT